MSTHIQIGEPYIDVDDGDVRIRIQDVQSPAGATPAFMSYHNGEVVEERTNHAAIATTSYLAGFERMGLADMFQDDETGFLRHHPCGPNTTLLTKAHLERLETTLAQYRDAHPDKLGDIGLLTWIIYWVRWALENCDTPAIWVF